MKAIFKFDLLPYVQEVLSVFIYFEYTMNGHTIMEIRYDSRIILYSYLICYCMSRKSCPFLYSDIQYKNGQVYQLDRLPDI